MVGFMVLSFYFKSDSVNIFSACLLQLNMSSRTFWRHLKCLRWIFPHSWGMLVKNVQNRQAKSEYAGLNIREICFVWVGFRNMRLSIWIMFARVNKFLNIVPFPCSFYLVLLKNMSSKDPSREKLLCLFKYVS